MNSVRPYGYGTTSQQKTSHNSSAFRGAFLMDQSMLKKLLIGAAILAGLAGSVQAAGTLPGISMSQQFGTDNKPLVGGKLYLIQAGTTSTPQNCYQDSGLSIAHPNPITLNAGGRIPQLFCADGSIKVRLTNAAGVDQLVQDNLLVVGPSGGGGGGGSVDPTTVFQTGDVMWLDVDGVRSGWVRDNGRTIGSASSGASERANADTSALFSYLWTTYSNTICPVSGGRGASAAADFAANKTIGLPNKQGLIPGGLDGMGNTASSVWASVPVVSGLVTTPGSVVGATLNTLITANLPPYTPAGTNSSITVNPPGGTPFFPVTNGSIGNQPPAGGGGQNVSTTNTTWSSASSMTGSAPSFTGTAQGGTSTAFNNVPRTVLGTFFRKL